jgi:ABC-type branched-subunit amino acid transport system substrate-binding protein
MKHGERNAVNFAMGNVDFSPEVDLAKKRRTIWQLVVKKWEGGVSAPSSLNGKPANVVYSALSV